MKDTKPTKLQYIGIWILTSTISEFFQHIYRCFLPIIFITDSRTATAYFLINSTASITISTIVFILTYNVFNTLNIKRVFPYLVSINALMASLEILFSQGLSQQLNIYQTSIYAACIIGCLAMFTTIRMYYIGKTERWY